MNEPILGAKSAEPVGENRAATPAASEAAPAQSESAVTPEQAGAVRESQPPAAERRTEPTPGTAAEARVAPSGAAAPAAVAPITPDPYLAKVERVLEDNLWDVYVSLPERARAVFKQKGEETATAIRALVAKSHVRASRIHDLIHKWLSKIPNVNEFFLLQESKIKTDTFVQLAAWAARKAGIG